MAYDLGVHARRSQEPLSDTEQTLASIRTELSDSNYLIVAVGIKLNWKAIKGLNVDQVGKNGICSNYLYDGCEGTWRTLHEFKGGTASSITTSSPRPGSRLTPRRSTGRCIS